MIYHMGGFLPVCFGAHVLRMRWPPPGWYVPIPTTLHWKPEMVFRKVEADKQYKHVHATEDNYSFK